MAPFGFADTVVPFRLGSGTDGSRFPGPSALAFVPAVGGRYSNALQFRGRQPIAPSRG